MVDLEATLRASLEGRYAIEGEVGHGGMSVVYRARDLKHNRVVAIKVLRPELSEQIAADRFNREIEVVAGLTHPHILPLHDSGDADGLLYYVMPFIEGETLRARVDRTGSLPVADAIRIAREIAGALGFAHRQGVVHRDVKPGNILLTGEHAVLADFGVAHLVETDNATLTSIGLALGTPSYFSPEQATAEPEIDGRSDIYSLGCVLFEALTGQPPFTGANVRVLMKQHILDPPPQVRDLRPEVSDGLDAVVQTTLQKEPERRFQTAEELAGSLDLVSGGFEAMAASALHKFLGPRHRWLQGKRLAALVTAAVVVLIAGGLLLQKAIRGPALADATPVYAILPYEGSELSEEELRLSALAARELYWHLMDWESIKVVGGPALEGPATRVVQAGLGLPTASLSAGLELLETLNATHLVYVEANARGDSVQIAASMHLRGRQDAPDRPVQGDGLKSELVQITAGMALQILGLHAEPAALDDLVSRSPYHMAHQEFDEGRTALWDWRLAEAEEHFQAAIEQDTAFALAHYYLAKTMYWRTVQDPERMLDGPTVAYHVRQADRVGTDGRLRSGERKQVNAFLSFWDGDYATARARYDSILAGDPTNLDALVLAGSVEYEDHWLADGRNGELLPRQDLNRARAMFDSAVSLSSHLQLAWGSLFEVDRYVARAAYQGECYGFQPPGVPMYPPYEFPEAADQIVFCPVVEDGEIGWKADPLSSEEAESTLAGVRERQARTVERLEWWARVEKAQPRPHEELADWMLWERSVPGCAADPVWADSLLRGARSHFETALEIRGDTTPQDRVRFATLLLASDDLGGAVKQANRALGDLGDWRSEGGIPPTLEAANVYMAAAEGGTAAEILERVWDVSTFAVPDPESEGEMLVGGFVWGTLWGIAALGVADGSSEELSRRFAIVERTWGEPQYTPRQRAALRFYATRLLSPGLVRLPGLWSGWFEAWDEYGFEEPEIWAGLRLADRDPDAARTHLDAAVRGLESGADGPVKASHYYMPIVLAETLGEEELATELRRRARACPTAVNRVDLGWGLKTTRADEARD